MKKNAAKKKVPRMKSLEKLELLYWNSIEQNYWISFAILTWPSHSDHYHRELDFFLFAAAAAADAHHWHVLVAYGYAMDSFLYFFFKITLGILGFLAIQVTCFLLLLSWLYTNTVHIERVVTMLLVLRYTIYYVLNCVRLFFRFSTFHLVVRCIIILKVTSSFR